MCLELEFVTDFCASCTAPWLSSNTEKHGIPFLGNMKRQTCLKISNSLTAYQRAVYSASVVESDVSMSGRTQGKTQSSMAQEEAHQMSLLAKRSPHAFTSQLATKYRFSVLYVKISGST